MNPLTIIYGIAFAIGIWVVVDSLKRGKLAWAYAVWCALGVWWICLPFYLAGRKLLSGEIREGGYAWNVSKVFLLFWTALIGICAVFGAVGVSNELSGKELSTAGQAGAALGVGIGFGLYFCLWIGVSLPVLIVGLLLKKNSVVENGDQQSDKGFVVSKGSASSPPQPPQPPSPSIIVQISRNGAIIGSYPHLDVRSMISRGQILSTDYYWMHGMANWDTVANFPF